MGLWGEEPSGMKEPGEFVGFKGQSLAHSNLSASIGYLEGD